MSKFLISLIASLLICSNIFAFDIPSSPEKFKYLNDYANLLSLKQQQSLEKGISEFYNFSDITVSLAIISDLYGDDIESVSSEWFNKWGIGGDENKGILILFSENDKLVRFETGYGVEHVLTDADCKRIQSQSMVNFFKDEYYYEGFVSGLQKVFSYFTDSIVEFEQIERFQIPSDLSKIYDPYSILSESENIQLTNKILENEKITEFPIFICIVDDLTHFDIQTEYYDEFANSIDAQYRDYVYDHSEIGEYDYMMLLLYKGQNISTNGRQQNLKVFGINPYGFNWYEDERHKFDSLTNLSWNEIGKIDITNNYVSALEIVLVGYTDAFYIVENESYWSSFWMYALIIGIILIISFLGFYFGSKSSGSSGSSRSSGGFGSSSNSNSGGSSGGGGGGNSYGSGSSGGGGATTGW